MFNIENRRYIGSKNDLTDWILWLVQENCKGSIFADIFAGTAIISSKAATLYSKIIVNDFLYSNYIIYKAFFENKSWDKEKIEFFINKWNKTNSDAVDSNYFSDNYGEKYFSFDDAKKIGAIREDIYNSCDF